jgi:hypothetical protein
MTSQEPGYGRLYIDPAKATRPMDSYYVGYIKFAQLGEWPAVYHVRRPDGGLDTIPAAWVSRIDYTSAADCGFYVHTDTD